MTKKNTKSYNESIILRKMRSFLDQLDLNRMLPSGGSSGQVLKKVNGTDYNTQWATPDNRQGFADYNDSATATSPISLVANSWAVVTNDTLGAFTNTTYIPDGVSSLFSSNEIDVSDLELGDAILIRYDFTITPQVNGSFAELRLSLGSGGGAYHLNRPIGTLANGAGYQYQVTGEFYVYMGDTNTRDNPIGLEAKCSENAVLQNAGMVIQVIRK